MSLKHGGDKLYHWLASSIKDSSDGSLRCRCAEGCGPPVEAISTLSTVGLISYNGQPI